jgi:hypothetical protein
MPIVPDAIAHFRAPIFATIKARALETEEKDLCGAFADELLQFVKDASVKQLGSHCLLTLPHHQQQPDIAFTHAWGYEIIDASYR